MRTIVVTVYESSQEEPPPQLSLPNAFHYKNTTHCRRSWPPFPTDKLTYDNFFLRCCYSHNPVLRQTMISCLQRNSTFLFGLAIACPYTSNLLRRQRYKIPYAPYKNSHLNVIELKKSNIQTSNIFNKNHMIQCTTYFRVWNKQQLSAIFSMKSSHLHCWIWKNFLVHKWTPKPLHWFLQSCSEELLEMT